jgi:methylated-DNA-[protein]-cysteine S-methyltransferase
MKKRRVHISMPSRADGITADGSLDAGHILFTMPAWTVLEVGPEIAFFLKAEEEALIRAEFAHAPDPPPEGWNAEERDDHDLTLRHAVRELREYFNRERRAFTVRFRLQGTPFQQAVWAELRKIPYGEVRTYADLAAAVHNPGALRAVGQANGANPLPVIVPCHRVIESDGGLGGFRGGLEFKRRLLAVEGYLLL